MPGNYCPNRVQSDFSPNLYVFACATRSHLDEVRIELSIDDVTISMYFTVEHFCLCSTCFNLSIGGRCFVCLLLYRLGLFVLVYVGVARLIPSRLVRPGLLIAITFCTLAIARTLFGAE